MCNELIFFMHSVIMAALTLVALWLGPHAIVAYISAQGILSNLFLTKQITLFGLNVTCSDAYAVGSILSLNLLQEYYGAAITKKAIFINFFIILIYLFSSQIHLLYIPNQFDAMHTHFFAILDLMPRITAASVLVYLIVQSLDATFFCFLKKIFQGKFPVIRSILSTSISQLLDTVLFSFLALYGTVNSVFNIIIVSFAVKIFIIFIFTPFIGIAKRFKCEQ